MISSDILAEPGTRPFPGGELAFRVAGDDDVENFFHYGLQSVQDNRNALASIGRRFEDYESILDFGCGCGRMLTWLEPLTRLGPTLHGIDTDADAIAWVRENLPFANVDVNDPLPPTKYADAQFDLVYNHSVFSHLDEARQNAWLLELRRVTRIGGHLLLSVHGEHAFAQYENALINGGSEPTAVRHAYSGHGLLFMQDEGWQSKGFPAWYGSTYHTTQYVFSHWTRWFRIKAYLPQGALNFQDIVVLERVADGQHHGEYLRGAALRNAAAAAPAAVESPRARAEAALARAEQLLARGPDTSPPSRLGPAGHAWRRALGRLIANYAQHERQVDQALIDALRAQIDSDGS